MLTVSNGDKEIAWKGCYGKLLNTQFAWDRNSCDGVDSVIGLHHLMKSHHLKS